MSGTEVIAAMCQISDREGTELPRSSALGNTTGFPQLGDLGTGLWRALAFWREQCGCRGHLISSGVLVSVCVISGGFYLVFKPSQVLLSGSTVQGVWGWRKDSVCCER